MAGAASLGTSRAGRFLEALRVRLRLQTCPVGHLNVSGTTGPPRKRCTVSWIQWLVKGNSTFNACIPADMNLFPERTLGLLFSAQQQNHILTPAHHLVPVEPQVSAEPPQPVDKAQRSLLSFFKISSAPTSSAASSTPSVERDMMFGTRESCEDCGSALGSDDADAMDVDGYGFEAGYSCGPCGKRVCSGCSVVSLAEQRCRDCASKTARVGVLAGVSAATLRGSILPCHFRAVS
jgi:hypothetical protein